MLSKKAASPGQLVPEATGWTRGRSPTDRLVQHDSTRTENAGRIDQEWIQFDTNHATATSLRQRQNTTATTTEIHERIVRANRQRIKDR